MGNSPAEGSQAEPGMPVSRMGIPQGYVWSLDPTWHLLVWHWILSLCPQQLPHVELGVTLDSCVLYSFSPQDHVRDQEYCCGARDVLRQKEITGP